PEEEEDARQLLEHCQKLVGMPAAVKNQLHGLAMGRELCRKGKLWGETGRKQLEGLELGTALLPASLLGGISTWSTIPPASWLVTKRQQAAALQSFAPIARRFILLSIYKV